MSPRLDKEAVEQLIAQMRQGKREAADALMEVLYPELRRLAALKMKRERADHTWQPTALVNELYLELIKARGLDSGAGQGGDEKKVFFGLAAHMMMRLLIHHARPLSRRVAKVDIEEESPAFAAKGLDELEALLGNLGSIDPQLRRVVEMKVFEGLSVEEMAGQLRCSATTIKRLWHFAKGWLGNELQGRHSSEHA